MNLHNAHDLFGPDFDRELRTYQLLALEQQAGSRLTEQRLFPLLARLYAWKAAVSELLDSKQQYDDLLQGGSDKTAAPEIPALLDDMYNWASEARDTLGSLIAQFEALKHKLISEMEGEPVGLLPIYREEGYFMISQGREASVYAYHRHSLYSDAGSARTISSNYFGTYEITSGHTPVHIKIQLIENNQSLPNPATWIVYAPPSLPIGGTLLPLAKEILNKMIDR